MILNDCVEPGRNLGGLQFESFKHLVHSIGTLLGHSNSVPLALGWHATCRLGLAHGIARSVAISLPFRVGICYSAGLNIL